MTGRTRVPAGEPRKASLTFRLWCVARSRCQTEIAAGGHPST